MVVAVMVNSVVMLKSMVAVVGEAAALWWRW